MPLAYSCLFVAIMLEVTGTMLLPASQNFSRLVPTIVLVLCYAGAFYLLTFAIQSIPLAIVYATWSGLGAFTIAVLGYFLFSHSPSAGSGRPMSDCGRRYAGKYLQPA